MFTGPLPKRVNNYHVLQVVDVVQETPTAKSIVLEVPRPLKDRFQYRAGQFLTIRLRLTGAQHIRCYSMSSSPLDDRIRITVKRVEGGVVSNWMNQWVKPGLKIEAMPPAGDFVLTEAPDSRDVVAFCSGSGVTPVMSIVTTALATTGRRVRVYYANQSRSSIIFDEALEQLAAQHPERVELVHHVYDEIGYLTTQQVADFLGAADADVYLCGSRHFMATTREALHARGLPPDRLHLENFTAETAEDSAADASPGTVVDRATLVASSRTELLGVVLRGQRHELAYDRGATVLEVCRAASISPPFACESGICGACVAFVRDGTVTMAGAHASLPADEVAAGWTLTCRAIPVSPSIEVEFPA